MPSNCTLWKAVSPAETCSSLGEATALMEPLGHSLSGMSQLSCCQQIAHYFWIYGCSSSLRIQPVALKHFTFAFILHFAYLHLITQQHTLDQSRQIASNCILKLYRFLAIRWKGKKPPMQATDNSCNSRYFIVLCRWSYQLLCEIMKVNQRQLPKVLSCIGKTGEQLTGTRTRAVHSIFLQGMSTYCCCGQGVWLW